MEQYVATIIILYGYLPGVTMATPGSE